MEEAIECLRHIDRSLASEEKHLSGLGYTYQERQKFLKRAYDDRERIFQSLLRRYELDVAGYKIFYVDGKPQNIMKIT